MSFNFIPQLSWNQMHWIVGYHRLQRIHLCCLPSSDAVCVTSIFSLQTVNKAVLCFLHYKHSCYHENVCILKCSDEMKMIIQNSLVCVLLNSSSLPVFFSCNGFVEQPIKEISLIDGFCCHILKLMKSRR